MRAHFKFDRVPRKMPPCSKIRFRVLTGTHLLLAELTSIDPTQKDGGRAGEAATHEARRLRHRARSSKRWGRPELLSGGARFLSDSAGSLDLRNFLAGEAEHVAQDFARVLSEQGRAHDFRRAVRQFDRIADR